MLTNNFKGLLPFKDTDFTFINVAGESLPITSVLDSYKYAASNNHNTIGALSYNYNTTTIVSSYIEEQALNNFRYIVGDYTEYTNTGLILFVGSGSTAPTSSDYKLENALTLASPFGSCLHKGDVTTITRAFTNDTENDVTINEVGVYTFRSGDSAPTSNTLCLVGRKVLTSGITLAPNETYTFTYQITMADFTFKDE